MSKNVSEVLNASMSKVREMVDANTVIGTPIEASNGTTLIPISRIGFTLASGGSDTPQKRADLTAGFFGGSGCGVKIEPVAMLVLQGTHVRLLPIGEPASSATERLVEQLPVLVDKLSELISTKKEVSEN